MKIIMRKYGLLIGIIITHVIITIFAPQIGVKSFTFTTKSLINFLFMIIPIFIIIGLLDVWIEKEKMVKVMGLRSGVKGFFIALLLGVITAVPLYALLPLAGLLLKKGSRIFNVLIFICSSASIRIPLLLFEVSSLGWKFTFTRCLLNVFVVFVIAFIIEKTLTPEDLQAIYDNSSIQ